MNAVPFCNTRSPWLQMAPPSSPAVLKFNTELSTTREPPTCTRIPPPEPAALLLVNMEFIMDPDVPDGMKIAPPEPAALLSNTEPEMLKNFAAQNMAPPLPPILILPSTKFDVKDEEMMARLPDGNQMHPPKSPSRANCPLNER
jgi:hypothetical protein